MQHTNNPLFDNLLAVGGNVVPWTASFITGNAVATMGGFFVSAMTGLYFYARFRREWDRRRMEAELHARRIRGLVECEECGSFNNRHAAACWDCSAELSPSERE